MIRKRDPITVTPAAWQHIGGILSANADQAFRIGVDTKGCAGHKYRYGLIPLLDIPAGADIMVSDSGTILIDRDSLLYLLGSTLDLRSDGISSQLVWDNPMAASTCGCGESFSTPTNGCSTR
jgi:iron-sulfur cluster assembly accessory protein